MQLNSLRFKLTFGVALLLWLSTMVLILANSAIGNTMIAAASARAAEIYNALVPLPYVALCAWILARCGRTWGRCRSTWPLMPRWTTSQSSPSDSSRFLPRRSTASLESGARR